jgi:hypothetical protein
MYKKIKLKVMATFNELKKTLQGKNSKPKINNIKPNIPEPVKDINLELEEARYLLSLIAKSDFSGKDIQIVYNVALKLQNIIEKILTSENNE